MNLGTLGAKSGRSATAASGSTRPARLTTPLLRRSGSYSCRVAVRIGTAGDPADFTGAPGDPDDLGEQVAALWVAGASRPEWCFVAKDESGARVGRVGYRVEPTVTNRA